MPSTYRDNPLDETNATEVREIARFGRFGARVSRRASSKQTERERKEIERLKLKHPDYADRIDDWKFYLRSYEGGKAYIGEDVLFGHDRETPSQYQKRLERASYDNYCAPLVDFVPEFIFAQDIDRTPPKNLTSLFDELKKDADRRGTPLNEFMFERCQDARIFGHVHVLVDAPPKGDGELSVAQARERGLRPYLVSIRPTEVWNWTLGEDGGYTYFKRVTTRLESGPDGFRHLLRVEEYGAGGVVQISEIECDPKSEDDDRLVSVSVTKAEWDQIPVETLMHRRSKLNKDLGVSFLVDIAPAGRDVFNYSSLTLEFAFRQCFNILAMESASQTPTRDQAGSKLSANVLRVPKDGKFPQYVTPPTEPGQYFQKERENVVQRMYRQAAQDVMSDLFGGESGDSKRWSFARTVPAISTVADRLQAFESRVFTRWAEMAGEKWEGGKVAYKDDYSVTNLMDMLLHLTSIFKTLLIPSPTFIKEEWKRVVREFDGKIADKQMDKIMKEIETFDNDELLELFRNSKDLKAEEGVPSAANALQGEEQRSLQDDSRRSLSKGDKASTKEKVRDRDRMTSRSRNK